MRQRLLSWDSLESRRLLTSITEFPLHAARSSPNGIVTGPDGNLWFTDGGTNSIGMINPTTHATSEFPIPTPNSGPYDIAPDDEGEGTGFLWFTENNASQIGMINVQTHQISEIPTPTPNSSPEGITYTPGAQLWFTESSANQIGMIDLVSHHIEEFTIPTANSAPSEITTDPRGNLWFTENNYRANQLGMYDPTTKQFTEIPLPTSDAFPEGIAAGPNGWIWFTEFGANQIGIYNPAAHVITDFPTPTADSQPGEITLGPDGQFWFTESSGLLGKVGPTSQAITEYPVKSSGATPAPFGITTGPDGNLWFTDGGTDSIGVLTPAMHLVVTAPPPNTVTGKTFSVTVIDEYDTGVFDFDFDGPVTVALAGNPGHGTLGGRLTVDAQQGVATFSGLTVNGPGSGYSLRISGVGATAVVTGSFTVSPLPNGGSGGSAAAPTIIGEQVLTAGKRKHKHAIGFELEFSTALDPARAGDAADYVLTQVVKHRRKLVHQSIVVGAAYTASTRTVSLTFAGKAKFARGGQLVVEAAAPGGLATTSGVYLDGNDGGKPGNNGVFTILPRASGITR